jgi:hypothetical protein
MGKILHLRQTKRGRSNHGADDVVVTGQIAKEADLRNLIDDWIVPKIVEDWMTQSEANVKPLETEDNGEHK